jgi:phage/conjugal plasmid C-4 type zinc finger TraR family protein
VTDFADVAAAREQADREHALAARPRPVALRHMTDECIDCGDDIPPARKAAIPDAARCLDCQERHERGEPR